MYHVEFAKPALRELRKLDKPTAGLIIGWIKKNIEGSDNPRLHGKSLKGDKAGQWRYRIGDYRVLAEIQDSKVLVLIINVGHRRDIYK